MGSVKFNNYWVNQCQITQAFVLKTLCHKLSSLKQTNNKITQGLVCIYILVWVQTPTA